MVVPEISIGLPKADVGLWLCRLFLDQRHTIVGSPSGDRFVDKLSVRVMADYACNRPLPVIGIREQATDNSPR